MDDHSAGYDFVKLGNGLAETLTRAAEEQVVKAQTMMDQTKALVEIIINQVTAQAKANEDMNARFKEVGSIMLDAHRILNGNKGLGEQGTAALKPAPLLDAARRGSFAGAGNPLGRIDPALTIDPKRVNDPAYRAPDPARTPSGLQREMADLDRFRVNRTNPSADRHDPSHDDLTGVDGNRAS